MADVQHRFDLAEVMDVAFQVYSTQISEDFLTIIRKYVLPSLDTRKGFGVRELRTLLCIYRHTQDMTASVIASILRYDPATITRAISKLKHDDLVVTVENAYDARSAIIKTTEAGDRLVEQYRSRHHAVLQQLAQMQDVHLSEHEAEVFMKVAQKIARRAANMRDLGPQDFKKRLKTVPTNNPQDKDLLDKLA